MVKHRVPWLQAMSSTPGSVIQDPREHSVKYRYVEVLRKPRKAGCWVNECQIFPYGGPADTTFAINIAKVRWRK